jgi:hypothetical protein
MRWTGIVLVGTLLGLPVLAHATPSGPRTPLPTTADDKKPPPKSGDKKPEGKTDFDDLFGAPAKGTSLDDVTKATQGIGGSKNNATLHVKEGTIDATAPVQLKAVFAAEHIEIDKRLGCQPAGKEKRRLVELSFNDLPAKAIPFEVCLTLVSKAGREMSMSVAIVDARNLRVAKAESVVDFRGKERVDHVLEFPAPTFNNPGPYQYVVDLDGQEAGRLPLFTVKVDANP